MIPDSFYGIVFERASRLTFCPLRKRNCASYPEELRPHALSKEKRQPTDSKCMRFEEVHEKGTFLCKKSETECPGNYQAWEFRLVQQFVFMLQVRVKIVSTNSLKKRLPVLLGVQLTQILWSKSG
jgi:hypothetical protein